MIDLDIPVVQDEKGILWTADIYFQAEEYHPEPEEELLLRGKPYRVVGQVRFLDPDVYAAWVLEEM